MPPIIGIDTTLNIGSYYVTPTTYGHAMPKNIKSDSQLTLLGPTMFHSPRNDDSFRYFASSVQPLERNCGQCNNNKNKKNKFKEYF